MSFPIFRFNSFKAFMAPAAEYSLEQIIAVSFEFFSISFFISAEFNSGSSPSTVT